MDAASLLRQTLVPGMSVPFTYLYTLHLSIGVTWYGKAGGGEIDACMAKHPGADDAQTNMSFAPPRSSSRRRPTPTLYVSLAFATMV